jgi:acetamidase/formamidase
MSTRTIHVSRDRYHLAWDNSIAPIATIASGECVEFDLLDASCGQIDPTSTAETIRTLDFARIDQVNGPIAVDGAMPGDTLEIEFLEIEPATWGWTAIIPGFGLLADEFVEPALKIWTLDGGAGGFATFAPGIRIPLAPFCGEIGLAPGKAGALSTRHTVTAAIWIRDTSRSARAFCSQSKRRARSFHLATDTQPKAMAKSAARRSRRRYARAFG